MFQVHKKLSSHFSKKLHIFVQKLRKLHSDKKPQRNGQYSKNAVFIRNRVHMFQVHKKLSNNFSKKVLIFIRKLHSDKKPRSN